jgi:hypothetical protein
MSLAWPAEREGFVPIAKATPDMRMRLRPVERDRNPSGWAVIRRHTERLS